MRPAAAAVWFSCCPSLFDNVFRYMLLLPFYFFLLPHLPTHDTGGNACMKLDQLATEAINPRTTTLDQMPPKELLASINREDQSVPLAVAKAIPQIARVVEQVRECLKNGGRLF